MHAGAVDPDMGIDPRRSDGESCLMADSHPGIREQITGAINGYLAVLKRPAGDSLRSLGELARALDQLVMCYHATPDIEPDTVESPAPRADEASLTEAVRAAYPELGWYALVDPDGDTDQEIGLTIATGNLSEIAVDLLEVLWLFDNASENDAVWEFRLGYQTHWGRHLHELRVYLHALAAW